MVRWRASTVDEYVAEFSKLSRFALGMMSNEVDKGQRFMQGLNFEIQTQIYSNKGIETYADVLEVARRVEQLIGITNSVRRGENKRLVGQTSGAIDVSRISEGSTISRPETVERSPFSALIAVTVSAEVPRTVQSASSAAAETRSVVFKIPDHPEFEFMSGSKVMEQPEYQAGMDGVLTCMEVKEKPILEIVEEFLDVLPNELSGLPLDRDIEIIIDLILGVAPILKPPYRMPIADLEQLRKKIQEYLDKKFIRLSTSPWGALVVINDLFDQLGEAKVFSKLDLRSGYHQLKQVSFLEHVISGAGINVDPKKVDAVLRLDPSTSVIEVWSFLGVARYYRKFIKDFTKIAGPLTRLTQKEVKFVWAQECQASFEELKNKLMTTPVLAIPDESGGFRVHRMLLV
ncbi:uncharacterized protein LOC109847694 [Asparagus officinalis]|uniref:uncharacterized protein LOC109847694 n=1 Tax=Asparagus officinalis TaxID=4686 RepID=UPI00098E31DB|nr:uncharacterized protein LOC109847694 [Asparagus officinalis]